MDRIIIWIVIWLATLCMLEIDIKYTDGLHIKLKGWPQSIGRWLNKRKEKDNE